MRIVVAHHPFASAPDVLRDKQMQKAQRAMECFVELNVEMILGGHLHRAYIGSSLDFYPELTGDRGIIIVQSGTTTSRRGRGREKEKNSLNQIEVSPSQICVTHFMYAARQARLSRSASIFFSVVPSACRDAIDCVCKGSCNPTHRRPRFRLTS